MGRVLSVAITLSARRKRVKSPGRPLAAPPAPPPAMPAPQPRAHPAPCGAKESLRTLMRFEWRSNLDPRTHTRLARHHQVRADAARALLHATQTKAARLLFRVEAPALIFHGQDDALRVVLDRQRNLPRISMAHRVHNRLPADMKERIGHTNGNVRGRTAAIASPLAHNPDIAARDNARGTLFECRTKLFACGPLFAQHRNTETRLIMRLPHHIAGQLDLLVYPLDARGVRLFEPVANALQLKRYSGK